MSFDIFLQGFRAGDAADGDGAAALSVLEPLILERDGSWARIGTADGEADVYGLDSPETGLMFNHVTGRAAWDVIHAVASDAGFVVMPVGCPTLVVDDARRAELPDGLADEVVLVRSGADILDAIEADG